MLTLFSTILLLWGKVNFTNLSRYSDISERTYRRHFGQEIAFVQLNQYTIGQTVSHSADAIGAIDCSFLAKSGKATYGLDWFYNGSANRSEKGLEISVIGVIDGAAHRGDALSVQQTPPSLLNTRPQGKKGKGKGGSKKPQQRFSVQDIERIGAPKSSTSTSMPVLAPLT